MNAFDFIIRDALSTDIDACIALDHTYETQHVWQMNMNRADDGWRVVFRTERLPRPVEHTLVAEPARLQKALHEKACFLVAAKKEESADVFGYLTLWLDDITGTATLHDLVVTRDLRGARIGTRLFSIAQQWAKERGAQQFIVQTQTKNYPAIQFCRHRGLTFCGFSDRAYGNHDIAIYFGQSLR